jgi:phosphoglycolate phosphatase
MTRYDLAIFDFDGTLADSAAWFRATINHVAQRYGFRQITDAELNELRGQRSIDIIRYLGVPTWKLPFIARHMRQLVARDAHLIGLFEGVDSLLSWLVEHDVTIAIVTSNSEANVRRILRTIPDGSVISRVALLFLARLPNFTASSSGKA